MAAGWSTVVVFMGGVALGSLGVGAWYERSARMAAEQQALDAERLASAQVNQERRLQDVERQRQQGKADARRVVDASGMHQCPLPDDVAGLLAAQVHATRSGGRRQAMPNGAVP